MMSGIQYYKETNFKETPIGKIPQDWQIAKLKDIVEINRETRDPSRIIPNETFLYVGIQSVEGSTGRITQANKIVGKEAPSRARRVMHTNDVIMSTVRPYLKAFAIVPEKYDNQICSTGFAVLTCREEMQSRYLLYTLLSSIVINQCNMMMVGGQYPALNASQVAQIRLPLPPPEEQQKIAEILSTVYEAIHKTDEVIAKTERLKKGLMQELLTKGIGHKEFRDTKIGRIPKDWDVVRLGEVLELCQYGLSIKMGDKGKYPIIRMDEIVDGYVASEIIKYVDLDEKTFRNFRLEKGDILFNRTNSYELVGRTGTFLLEGDYVFASYLIRLRPNREMIDPSFLTFYLIFTNNRLRQLATRAVHQANINATNLKRFRIPLPPLAEQKKIVSVLSTVYKKLEVERKEKARLERIKQGLMNLFLSGKTRVKVN